MRAIENWPRLVLIVLPPALLITACAILVYERLQPENEKAIRLVKESNSRKENFTVQQYLYTTVYYRKDQGEAISIQGWRAIPSGQPGEMKVEFTYTDPEGPHLAAWSVNVKQGSLKPDNEAASAISWR